MSSYLQPVFQFPNARGGSLSIFIASSTDLADAFDPVSGAVVSNPVPIDTVGYSAPFHVDADKTYDLVVKDFGGATVLTINNVAVASGGGGGAGVPGPQGPRGPIGLTGAAGKDGVDGSNGTDGTNGADGAPGAPGVGLYRIVVDPESTTGRILYSYTDSPEEWHEAGSIMPAGQGMVKTGPSDSLGYLEQKIQAGPGVAVETDGQKITLSSTYTDDHRSQVHSVSTVHGYLSELFQAGVGVQISMDAAYNKMVISATGSAVGGWQWGGNWDTARPYNLNTAVWYLDNTAAVPVNRLYIATAPNQGVNPYLDAGLGAGSAWSCMCAIDYLGDQFAKLDATDTTSGYLADKLRAGDNIVFTRVDEATGSHYLISTVAPYQVLVGATAKEYNQLYGVLEFVGSGGTTTSWNGRAVQINGLALGTTSTTAARGDQGLTAYNHSQAAHAPVNADNTQAVLNAGASKATPVDADTLALLDSASSNSIKKLSWANVKATLKSYFDGIYSTLVLGTTSTTAARGDQGLTAYNHSQVTGSNPHGTTAAQISFTPVGGVSSVSTQAAIAELDVEKLSASTAASTYATISQFDACFQQRSGVTPTTDLNTVTTPGSYRLYSPSAFSATYNQPVGAFNYGQLRVYTGENGQLYQEYTPNKNDGSPSSCTYHRIKFDTTTSWRAWDRSLSPSEVVAKQDALTFDSTPTDGSTNPVTSNGVYDALAELASEKLSTTTAATTYAPINTTLADNAASSTLPTTASGSLVSKIQQVRDYLKYLLAQIDNCFRLEPVTVAATTDWNDVVLAGSYRIVCPVPFSVTYNQPVGVHNYGQLRVFTGSNSQITQEYIPHKVDGSVSSAIYRRIKYQAGIDWSIWVRDIVTDDLAGKQNTLTFDSTPTDGSTNPVTSNGVYDALAGKAPINATLTLGSGFSSGASIVTRAYNSGNAYTNNVIYLEY